MLSTIICISTIILKIRIKIKLQKNKKIKVEKKNNSPKHVCKNIKYISQTYCIISTLRNYSYWNNIYEIKNNVFIFNLIITFLTNNAFHKSYRKMHIYILKHIICYVEKQEAFPRNKSKLRAQWASRFSTLFAEIFPSSWSVEFFKPFRAKPSSLN